MPDLPVSLEEPKPGSLCDLTSRRSPSLSLLAPLPSLTLFPAFLRIYNSWAGRCSPLPCPLSAKADEVGGAEEVGTAPWCEGVAGWTWNSGTQHCCWEAEPAIASSWEQLLASMAWRRSTGDLQDVTDEHKRIFVSVAVNSKIYSVIYSLISWVYSSTFLDVSVRHHLYVVVAELGEEQELDLSPLRKRLDLGPPARGLSGVWDRGQRKLAYSPQSLPSPPLPAFLLLLSPWVLRPTSIRQESSEGEESSGMSTISDINRDPLSMDTNRRMKI